MTPAVVTTGEGVTIVTQTRVAEGGADAFVRFQADIEAVIARQPGFIEQSVLPPNPPVQVDWVILQRFRAAADAVGWLRSDNRMTLVAAVQAHLVGPDDVHLLRDGGQGALPSPVSVVIATRVKPGCEAPFRLWEHRIAAAQTQARGFAGYRLEPPIPGVQDDFVAILRFDSADSLQQWMDSPARAALLAEATPFTAEVRTRRVQAGFSQWFTPAGGNGPAAWKQNMLVVLMLYPVVFLFGLWVGTPLLGRAWGLPFWLALFVGNVFSVTALNWLVPWVSRRFAWWLKPAGGSPAWTPWAGVAALVGLYVVTMAVFSRL